MDVGEASGRTAIGDGPPAARDARAARRAPGRSGTDPGSRARGLAAAAISGAPGRALAFAGDFAAALATAAGRRLSPRARRRSR